MLRVFCRGVAWVSILSLLLGLVPAQVQAAGASERVTAGAVGPVPSDAPGPSSPTTIGLAPRPTLAMGDLRRDRSAWLKAGTGADATASRSGGWWSRRSRSQKVWIIVGCGLATGAVVAIVSNSGGSKNGGGSNGGGY